MSNEINIGDLFWDEHHCWCDGSKHLDICYLVLSADTTIIGKEEFYLYRCALFMWIGDGYCGAPFPGREFTKQEVLKMTKVGNLSDIKNFNCGFTGGLP